MRQERMEYTSDRLAMDYNPVFETIREDLPASRPMSKLGLCVLMQCLTEGCSQISDSMKAVYSKHRDRDLGLEDLRGYKR